MDLLKMMKQARELQEKMQRMQDELAALTVEGQSGGGAVKVTLNGKGEMIALRIDPSLAKADEVEILEDLVVAAARDAKSKAEAAAQARMQEATAGLPLPPGMKLF
jgi:DNA-binding YbaB/EbfC family protein